MLPILVINLDRRPDRLGRIANLLGALGLEFERIAAIDARDPDFARISAGIGRRGPLGSIGDGMVACALSHARAWQAVLDSGAPHALILEDDAEFSPALPAFLEAFAQAAPDLALVKLERFHNERGVVLGTRTLRIGDRSVARLHSLHAGGAGYILSRRGAAHCLDRFARIDLPIDHFLFNPVRGSVLNELEAHQVCPALIRQGSDPATGSDTRHSRQIDQHDPWARLRYHLRRGVHELAPVFGLAPLLLSGAARLRRVGFG